MPAKKTVLTKPLETPKKKVSKKQSKKKAEPKKGCLHLLKNSQCPLFGPSVEGKKNPDQAPYNTLKGMLFCTDCDSVVLETHSGAICLCDEEGDNIFHETRDDYPDTWIEVDVKIYEKD